MGGPNFGVVSFLVCSGQSTPEVSFLPPGGLVGKLFLSETCNDLISE